VSKLHEYYIGTQPEPEKRMRIHVDAEDARRIRELPRNAAARVEVVNRDNGEILKLRRASCGAPRCLCALEVVKFS
jgi:hypothetical protein